MVLPNDAEVAVQGSVVHETVAGGPEIEFGSTTVSASWGWRQILGSDFLSVEGGYTFNEKRDVAPDGDSYYARLRAQGGWTLLGFDASVTWRQFPQSSYENDDSLTYSLGYRGQFGRSHIGMDLVREQVDGSKDANWVDFVYMRREMNGSSLYAIVSKRLSDEFDDWYFGVGYQLHFELNGHRVR